MQETLVQSLGWEDPLEKEMTIYSSILAWEIPWTEEPGGLQSMGSQRVVHEWVTKHHYHHLKLSFVFLLTCSCPYKLPIDSMPFLPQGLAPLRLVPLIRYPLISYPTQLVVCLHSLQLTDANFKDHCPLFPTLWAILVQAAITNYCRLGGLNNEYLFLTVLKTGSPRSGCQLDWVPVRAWFWVPDCGFFSVLSKGR